MTEQHLHSALDHPGGLTDRIGGRGGRMLGFYLVVAGLALAIHATVVAAGLVPVLEGKLLGTDGYTRLLRVMQLQETGSWYDGTIARGNAPYGEVLHWTRPMDLLLLAGAGLLTPMLGFAKALFWWGAAVSPLLHVMVLFAAGWALAPIFDPWRRFFAMTALLLQMGVLTYAVAGRPDHHMLVLLGFVVTLGLTLRVLLRPFDLRLALAAGASLGFGLWLSMEFLLMLGAAFGALTIVWIRCGSDMSRKCLGHAMGLAAVLAVAVLAERPLPLLLEDQYDRVSVVHLTVALLALTFWAAVVRLEITWRLGNSPAGRLAISLLGAVVAGALLFLAYPKFFGGPEVDVDPRLAAVFFDVVRELQPLLPVDARSLGRFLVYLGPALVAVPCLVHILWNERHRPTWSAWLYLALCTAVFLPLALWMQRFAPYAEVILAVLLAEFLARLLAWLQWISMTHLRAVVRFGLALALLAGFPLAGASLAPAEEKAQPKVCQVDEIAALLNDPRGLGDRPRIIMAHMNHGPELLYRTAHSIIASPYHRNAAGLLDSHEAFTATELERSRSIVAARGVDLILSCRGQAGPEAAYDDETFLGGLRQGRAPSWLRAIELPPRQAERFVLYEVVR